MDDTIRITPLELSDWRALHALCTHPDVVYWLDGHPLEPAESFLAKLEQASPHMGSYYLAAREGERLVGFAWLTLGGRLRSRRSAWLSLAVHPNFQRQGLGQRLLQEIITVADRWLDLITISTSVPFDHLAALQLLPRHGFVIDTHRKRALLRGGALIDTTQLTRVKPGFSQDPEELLPPPVSIARPREEREVTIRAMTPDDIDAITESFQDPTAYWGTLQLPYPPRELWRKRLTTHNEPRHMFVAEVGGKVVGNLALHGTQQPRRAHGWLLGIGVHAHYQGAGIGQRLMSAALDFADQWLGVRRIELDVYVDNTRAIKLYERHGFMIEGRNQYNSYRDGAYVDVYVMGRLRP